MDLFDTNVDIVHCSYKNVDESGNILSVVGSKSKQIKMNHDEGMECLLAGKYFAGGLWNKIYRAKLFSNVRLKEDIKFNEDVLANYYLLIMQIILYILMNRFTIMLLAMIVQPILLMR